MINDLEKDRDSDRGLDDLLKRALADDLPADVEAGLRERVRSFRAGKAGADGRAAAWAAARARLFGRSAWAVLSVLMLIAGFLLQGLGSRHPLADRIVAVKAGLADVETTRR